MNRNKNLGITLVELMIAMVISMFLGIGVIQIFSSNSQTYRMQEAMSRVQENGRFALDFLGRDIRMVGYYGCTTDAGSLTIEDHLQPSNATAGYGPDIAAAVAALSTTDSLLGVSFTTKADLQASNLTLHDQLVAMGMKFDGSEESIVENTDFFIERRAEACAGSDIVNSSVASAEFTIADNSSCKIKQNDIIMISDCEKAAIIGISNDPRTVTGKSPGIGLTHGANWNDAPLLGGTTFADGSSILKMRLELYYIGYGESGEPALFRYTIADEDNTVNQDFAAYELVEGIEDMEILYGEDRSAGAGDETADIYVPASAVNDFSKVVAMRVTLTARSEDNVIPPVTSGAIPVDYRIRRNFNLTTTIRNRAGS